VAEKSKLQEVLENIGHAADFFGIELTDVNQRGVYGNTPLKIATVRGDVEAVRVLLVAGAEIDAIVEEDCTALYYAASFNKPDVVQVLLEHGASLETRNSIFGDTPLEVAERKGHREVLALLQEYASRPRPVH
jgi:ankyrin repeat protein